MGYTSGAPVSASKAGAAIESQRVDLFEELPLEAANPFRIDGPALISFSGGRSSGVMLRKILDAHHGELPEDVIVTFANTGRELPETLDFVRDCSLHWNVPIRWLERMPSGSEQRFVEVGHNSAARNGEPFSQLIREKSYLPNPVTRFCTIELKIRVMRDFARSLGWKRWTNVVGLRADEPGRVGSAYTRNAEGKERFTTICPLHSAGITEEHVLAFWREQAFDLALESYEGNCDLCFLKGQGKITRIMRDRPGVADWWIGEEQTPLGAKGDGARFRADRPSYADLLEFTERQGVLPFDIFDDNTSCGSTACTD